MESLNRLSILAVYVVAGVVIGAAAWLGGHYYAVTSAAMAPDAASKMGGIRPAVAVSDAPVHGIHVDHLFAQRAQIARLQRLLDEKTELLEKKNQLLENKTREQLTMEAELNEAIAMIEAVMAEQAAGEDPQRVAEDERLRAELERLRDERNRNAALADLLEGNLEHLRLQLVTTDENIARLQHEAELEAALLLAEMRAFKQVATDTLASLGEDAVGALADLLEHERPRIRRWAAQVLAEIGPPAREAVPALIDALGDEDPEVQLSVRRALDSIQPVER
jgi:hypothetical protein